MIPLESAIGAARKRIVTVLFITQSFFSASSIAAFTLSPIIAASLSGSDAAAGIPNTLVLLGRAGFALPLGFMMDRFGRRVALTGGYSTAILGSLIAAWAVFSDSYAAFLLGALFLGMARGASDQSRYVGAEIFPLASRARIIGIIVSAGTIGAILGPLLVPASAQWVASWGLPESAGPFLASAVLMLGATAATFFFLRPDPQQLGQSVAEEEAVADPDSIENQVLYQRSLVEIFSAPMVQLAILAMVLSFFVMSFVMVITPLHMDHHDHTTAAISGVIMAHTLGMFGLSWATGWLIDRLGRIPIIAGGALILALSCILAPLSLRLPILSLALFLLGIGWNFCYVAGSSLLSDALAARERGRAQGASEALVAITAGTASMTVGLVFARGDYLLVSSVGIVFSLLLVLSSIVLARRDRKRLELLSP